jgi:hypothetical protein
MNSVQVLVWAAVLAPAALAVIAAYRWRQRKRALQVGDRVREFLSARYGEVPGGLNVNCSDDPLWPVLVSFQNPHTGSRHRLQFACPGPASTLSFLSEKEEERSETSSPGLNGVRTERTPGVATEPATFPAASPGAGDAVMLSARAGGA